MRQFDPDQPELMDVEQPVSSELRRDLANLVTLNRVFGSHRLVIQHLRTWLQPGRPWHILDLATGAGDIPRLIAQFARSRGITVTIDAVDQQSSTIEIAREASREFPEITYHQGDIRSFGEPGGWDIVLCSLALHHFSEADAVTILRHAHGLARQHVLVTDLRRSPLATAAIDLLTAVWMREPMTRHDARASARRAFSFPEFAALARHANWPPDHQHRKAFCFRQAVARSQP